MKQKDKETDKEMDVNVNMPECSIAFEQTDMAPNGQEIKKKAIEVKGDSLEECKKHFNEIWNEK